MNHQNKQHQQQNQSVFSLTFFIAHQQNEQQKKNQIQKHLLSIESNEHLLDK